MLEISTTVWIQTECQNKPNDLFRFDTRSTWKVMDNYSVIPFPLENTCCIGDVALICGWCVHINKWSRKLGKRAIVRLQRSVGQESPRAKWSRRRWVEITQTIFSFPLQLPQHYKDTKVDHVRIMSLHFLKNHLDVREVHCDSDYCAQYLKTSLSQ